MLVAGLALRIAMQVGMWPTYFDTGDVWQSVAAADNGPFGDPLHPAGYALFLRALRPFSSSVLLPVVVQHLLGLGSAVLLRDAGRRLGLGPWARLLPPAVVLLSVDQIITEHRLMTDAVFGAALLLGLWCVLAGLTATGGGLVALAGGGVALAAAAYVRLAGAPLVLVTFLVVAAWPGRPRERLGRAAALGLGALVVVGSYQSALFAAEGRFRPVTTSGWTSYVRVAPFADCSRFEPPTGTEFLCETSAPSTRPGADYYAWGGGPARERYGDFTQGNRELAAFAAAVVRAQPLDYAAEVAADAARYVLPIGARRSVAGGLPMSGVETRPDPAVQALVEGGIESYYDPTTPAPRPSILSALDAAQPVLRAGTPFVLAPLVLGCVAVVRRGGRRRWELLLGLGWVLTVIGGSAMTVGYVWRYALPVLPVAALVGGLAVDALRRPGDQSASSSERAAPSGASEPSATAASM